MKHCNELSHENTDYGLIVKLKTENNAPRYGMDINRKRAVCIGRPF